MARRLTNGPTNITNISFYGYLFIRDGYNDER